jgi:hypothetical protein
MATKDATPIENCPFWATLSMKCRIYKGGLFIPLDDHIQVYCKTLNYPQCLQYELHLRNHLEIIDKANHRYKNRRKFTRIEARYKITLVRLIHSDMVVSHYSTLARTLDLSNGGMRLTTHEPLINDTVLQFSFGDTFPEHLQEGTGQVAWCNKEVDAPGYQAGISFHDDQTVEAMGLYLGLHHYDR